MCFRQDFVFIIVFLMPLCCSEQRYAPTKDYSYLEPPKESDLSKQFQALILKLVYKSQIQHCFAIITDSFYSEMWKKNFFSEQFHLTTYFIMQVNDSEDMLNPNYKTVRILQEIKRKNCDFVLIFLLNGIQIKRFLIFMDEHRVLNTRSRFVFSYDHRIFSRDIHYIWRRILSVVFIRTIEKQMRSTGEYLTGFEILTVPFPNILQGSFVGKSIGLWINGRLAEKGKLFYDKASNLEALKLKVAAYEHTPMVLKQADAFNKFSGVEAEIVEAISGVMNFTVQYYQSTDFEREKWGRKLLNESYTGVLGEMVNRKADLAIADLQMTSFHLSLMDLSIPHSSECLTFLTPESTTDNSWKMFILPLSSNMWTGVLVSLFLVGSIFYVISCVHGLIIHGKPFENPIKCILARTNSRSRRRKAPKGIKNTNVQQRLISHDIFDYFSDCLLLTYSMLLQVALPRMPHHWPLRILTGWYWTYCIQVVVIYRASLTAILANPSPRITIDTLEELADSSLTIAAWGEQNREFFNTAFDETAQRIAVNLEQIDDPEKAVSQISTGKYAYFDNEYYLRHLRLKRSSKNEEDGEEVLHIMRECVLRMPVSIGLEKNSPLKPNVDKYLRRLIEGGLVAKWLKDSTKNLVAEEQPPREALMDLKKFWSSIVVLGIGYFIAILGFAAEYLHFNYIVKNHPLYDRYNPRVYYQFVRNRM